VGGDQGRVRWGYRIRLITENVVSLRTVIS
jgi:hypothetical protein